MESRTTIAWFARCPSVTVTITESPAMSSTPNRSGSVCSGVPLVKVHVDTVGVHHAHLGIPLHPCHRGVIGEHLAHVHAEAIGHHLLRNLLPNLDARLGRVARLGHPLQSVVHFWSLLRRSSSIEGDGSEASAGGERCRPTERVRESGCRAGSTWEAPIEGRHCAVLTAAGCRFPNCVKISCMT